MPRPPQAASPALAFDVMPSPVGDLLLAAGAQGLCHIIFQAGPRPATPGPDWRRDPEPLAEARAQLAAYFAGELRRFTLPLAPSGTSFQQTVWRALRDIPHGQTSTYGALARKVGRPTASRAVGAANGQNPLPIVVPCHRVVGSDGSLTGFAGGLKIKSALLELEGVRVEGGQMRLALE